MCKRLRMIRIHYVLPVVMGRSENFHYQHIIHRWKMAGASLSMIFLWNWMVAFLAWFFYIFSHVWYYRSVKLIVLNNFDNGFTIDNINILLPASPYSRRCCVLHFLILNVFLFRLTFIFIFFCDLKAIKEVISFVRHVDYNE